MTTLFNLMHHVLVMIIIILTQTQLGERALLFSSLAALKESLQDQVRDHVYDHDHIDHALCRS